MLEDKFSSLQIKILIIVGIITLFVIFCILIALLFLFVFPKNDDEVDIEEYKGFLEDFDKGEMKEILVDYPVLPQINDFSGKPIMNLLDIKIKNKEV